MSVLIGLDSTVGLAKETAWGTAPTMGAGHEFQPAAPISDVSGKTRNIDETSLGQAPTRTSKVQGQQKVTAPCLPCYQGSAVDIMLATLFDSHIAKTQSSAWRPSYRREFELANQPVSSYAMIWTPDASVWVKEIAGIRTQQAILAAADGNEASLNIDGLGLPYTTAGVNGATQVGNLTHGLDPSIWDYMHFDHAKLWLAKYNETLAVLQVGKFALTMFRGLSENNRATKDQSGIVHVGPKRTAKYNFSLAIQPKEMDSDYWGAAWDDESTLFKAVLELTGDRGAAGVSVSGEDPTDDISGMGAGSLGVNINGDGARQITVTPAGLTTRTLWAAHLQAQIRAMGYTNYRHAAAVLGATVEVVTTGGHDYVKVTAGDYRGDNSSVVITAGSTGTNYATAMELGVAGGGTEVAGESNRLMMFLPELLYVSPDPRSYSNLDRIAPEIILRARQMGTAAPTGFANGDQEYLTTDCIKPRLVLVNQLASGPLDP